MSAIRHWHAEQTQALRHIIRISALPSKEEDEHQNSQQHAGEAASGDAKRHGLAEQLCVEEECHPKDAGDDEGY